MKKNFLLDVPILSILFFFNAGCFGFEEKKRNDDSILFLSAFATAADYSNCGSSASAPRVDVFNGLTRIFTLPVYTGSCLSSYNEPILMFLPSVAPKNLLSVFLPGSGGNPIGVSKIIEEGARRGYHSIGLTYPNADPINVICNSGPFSSLYCFGEVREEILTGENRSSAIAVDRNNSVEGRLLKLLLYLRVQRPNDGWEQFLKDGDVDWSRIYLGGHSQGSGHAAYQGKRKSLGRVSIYSGVSDYHIASSAPASWLGEAGSTASDRYFGFIHVGDPVANFSGDPDQVTDVWLNSFGMTGAVTDADSGVAPYGNSRRLTTELCSASGDNEKHNCTVTDGQQAVWDYISFP
ncbi:hypothetical protein EHQ12_07780 [Leptospira gomenensis]|uniref:Alpha/beta hydrolase n=1 Tax=Leptospira gomenensis TaxID=2484974 RepID=A0A5F1YB90_9LEPT|nr:hypothetical protein [Leptospira gomenensis]TGK34580.1 hypothetical protein EHQ17_09175 [Leptospira gomenensis]TGK40110.1 hypothetical protein EHQ07_18725 [Leptospira gomenensis]TGK40480.1 hypothetical protein EHQ12_07780 [Leptospira gomenensis]TGK55619.1 hypothetical protein EHQ13_16950 [Leptospira gomenensis]